MSQINVNRIKDSNEGAPDFPSGVNVSGVTSTVTLGVTNLNTTNLNVSGVVTATTLDGSLPAAGTPTLGLGVTINASGLNISGVATAGIVSATTLYGDGTNITGIALTIAPLNYNPSSGATGVLPLSLTGIGVTFNQAIKAGSGNITLRTGGYDGTVVENFGIGNSVTIAGNSLSFSPTSALTAETAHYVTLPSGLITNMGGDVSFVGTQFSFTSGRAGPFELWMWGYNNQGDLGQNDRTYRSSPVQVPGDWYGMWSAAGGGGYNMTAEKAIGTLWCWGKNDWGNFGSNFAAKRSSPVQTPGTTWAQVDTGEYSTRATKTDGTLWSWGYDYYGSLGQNQSPGAPAATSSPVQVPGTTWGTEDGSISGGTFTGYGVKTDGTLWSWGLNDSGNLGLNDRTKYSSPVQVGSDTTWSKVVGDNNMVSAIKTDGTLWVWGYNDNGKLGLNQVNNTRYSSPVQVPGTTWKRVALYSGYYTMATKTNGTLWAWGNGSSGQLGVNSVTVYSSPIQIPGTTWDEVDCAKSVVATKTDGTLWAWGYNSHGALGNNNRTEYSSPIQITGTDWVKPWVDGSGAAAALKSS